MNTLEQPERWAIAILLMAAILTFFFPLVSVQIPIVGTQSWSGYDVFSKMSGFEKQVASTETGPAAELSSSTDQALPPTPSMPVMPTSVQLIGLVPFEICFAWGLSTIALLFVFLTPVARRVRVFSLLGSIVALMAILHLVIASSDLHSWFEKSLTAGPSDKGNPFAAFAQQLGSLIANSVQIRPGMGLYSLVILLVISVFLAYSRILKRGSADIISDAGGAGVISQVE